MQLRDHARLLEQLVQRLPDDRIEPIRADELGGTPGRPADGQRRVPFALVIEIFILFADAQLPDAHHAQPALAAFDERPQQIPA